MRYAFFALLMVWSFVIGTSLAERVAARQFLHVAWPSVVHVLGTNSRCTGFIVGRGLVATAGHCVHPTDKVQVVQFTDGKIVPYRVISYTDREDCTHDWALLMANTGPRQPFSLSRDLLLAGTPLWRVGYARDEIGQLLKTGKLTTHIGMGMYLTGTAIPGESGSPVFDGDGDVVGIAVCGTRKPLTIASPVSDLMLAVALMRGGK